MEKYEIWADCGPVGNTEKQKFGWLWATFEGFFSFQKIFKKFKKIF